MKLLRLKINSRFSSLAEGFELKFRSSSVVDREKLGKFNPYCFAGLNGSGKSNALEALSNIFYHLEGCVNIHQPDSFKLDFNPKIATLDAYELEYYIIPKSQNEHTLENMAYVSIIKTCNEEPTLSYSYYPFEKKLELIKLVTEEFDNEPASAKNFLPDLVIGYTSGENEVLSIPFIKNRILHFDEYKESVTKNLKYEKPESSLLYIDYEMSQAVLLSNFLFQEKEVLVALQDELGIQDIKRFRMNINLHKIKVKNKSKYLIEQIDNTIIYFKNCATSFFQNEEKLILDFWINEETKKSFKKNFDDIFKLFQSFQILYTLNYRTVSSEIKKEVYQSKGYYTNGKIPEPALNEKTFYFLDYYIKKKVSTDKSINLLMRNLSDGEQQFLHSLGICLMLKNKRVLLLFDEPETHFNPDWRSKFISILEKSLVASESNNLMKDILITSHSPFLISDCYPSNVMIFGKDDENNVTVTNALDKELKTFGAAYDIIMEEIFNKNESIGNYSHQKISGIDFDKIQNSRDIIRIKKNLLELGDSYEKDMLFSKLNRIQDEFDDATNI